jgi:rubrerythrin
MDKPLDHADNLDALSMQLNAVRPEVHMCMCRMLERQIEELEQMTDDECPDRAQMCEDFAEAIEITERVFRYEQGLSDEL